MLSKWLWLWCKNLQSKHYGSLFTICYEDFLHILLKYLQLLNKLFKAFKISVITCHQGSWKLWHLLVLLALGYVPVQFKSSHFGSFQWLQFSTIYLKVSKKINRFPSSQLKKNCSKFIWSSLSGPLGLQKNCPVLFSIFWVLLCCRSPAIISSVYTRLSSTVACGLSLLHSV